jgi:hypothetical protein
MDIKINIDSSLKDLENNNYKIDNTKFHKMVLLYNALDEGWTIKKRNNSYIFLKNHEGKKEVISDSYLARFMKTNFDVNKILS